MVEVARSALGKGYSTVLSVGILGWIMWSLDRVVMGCVEREGLGISGGGDGFCVLGE